MANLRRDRARRSKRSSAASSLASSTQFRGAHGAIERREVLGRHKGRDFRLDDLDADVGRGAFAARADARRRRREWRWLADSYALLLLVGFVGSVNPSGGSASSFVPVEHAVLTREAADAERTKAFARYSLVGELASAWGAPAAAMPELFTRTGWSELSAIKTMVGIYALLGLVGGLLYTRIPRRSPPTP